MEFTLGTKIDKKMKRTDRSKEVKQLINNYQDRFSQIDVDFLDHFLSQEDVQDSDIITVLKWWISRTEEKADLSLYDFLVSKNVIEKPVKKPIQKDQKKAKKKPLTPTIKFVGLKQLRVQKFKIRPSPEPSKPTAHKEPQQDSTLELHESPQPKAFTEKSYFPKIGDRLGKCIISGSIGEGSSARVFKGLHESLNIPVAIKFFSPQNERISESNRRQFRAEARTLARLNHPHIVRVLDFEDGKVPYIVLEYVKGKSLATLIKENGRIRCQAAVLIIYRCTVALMTAHQHGIIHRDIKPANILIGHDGHAKLTDLGQAYMKANLETQQHSPRQFNGTPAYAAPEQVFNPKIADVRSDIYSLGATFYHTITGVYPFSADSVYEMVMKHLEEPLVPPHELQKEIPVEISECIVQMMAKKPEDRHQTIEDLLPDFIEFIFSLRKSGDSTPSLDDEIREPNTSPITEMLFRNIREMVGAPIDMPL